MFIIVLGLGFVAAPRALADYRFTFVGSAIYLVFHDGSGPYILVSGVKHRVQPDQTVNVHHHTFPIRNNYKYLYTDITYNPGSGY